MDTFLTCPKGVPFYTRQYDTFKPKYFSDVIKNGAFLGFSVVFKVMDTFTTWLGDFLFLRVN